MNNSNPVFKNIVYGDGEEVGNPATYAGISLKTFLCLMLTIASGIGFWFLPSNLMIPVLIGSVIVTLACSVIGTLAPKTSMVCSILYSVAEGASLGLISGIFEAVIPGIILTATVATVTVFGVSLLLFATGLIRVSSKMRKFVLISLISIMLLVLFGAIAGAFGFYQVSEVINGSGPIAIVLGAFIVFVAAISLITSFDDAARIVESNSPKSTEWMAAFGLSISVLYLYFQILRLLAIIASSSRKN